MTAQGQNVFEGLDIIVTEEVGTKTYEVCATCEAAFDENASRLAVALNAFVRRFEIRGKDEILRPPWLPKSETVKTGVDREEVYDAAKEIFANWAKRVRCSIPPGSEWTRHPEWLQKGKDSKEQAR